MRRRNGAAGSSGSQYPGRGGRGGATPLHRADIRANRSPIERTTFLYATRDQDLHLDRIIDRSAPIAGKRPVLVFSFGGGWESGQRRDPLIGGFAEHFASLGYVVVSIDYRLGIKATKAEGGLHPGNSVDAYLRAIRWGVEDLYDATAHILEHSDEWGIDPNQIVACGSSAGATNALVAEYELANGSSLALERLPPGFNYAGLIAMAGAFWLAPGSPLSFKSDPCPIMFFHGGKDALVTYDEVHGGFDGYGPAAFQRRFPDGTPASWFVDVPEGDHLLSIAPLIEYREEIEAFLDRMVRRRQRATVHTVETHRVRKTFANFRRLYGKPLSSLMR